MKLQAILFLAFYLPAQTNAQVDTSSVHTDSAKTALASTFVRTQPVEQNAKVYHINKAVDYPITVALGGTAIYMLTIVYTKKPTPESVILNLNKDNLSAFDRPATNYHDLNLDKASYYPFFAVMPLPLVLLADKNIAKDKDKIGVLYLESFAFEGIMYTSAVHFVDRFRPDVYNTSLPMSYRTEGNYRNSFFAGHVAVVANSTFFIAKVYNDYHPHSKARWWLYGGATAATIGMSYMRYASGKHFPSDIVTGAAIGTACGLLTPTLHKNRDFKKQKWSLAPALLNNGSAGFCFTYKLGTMPQ